MKRGVTLIELMVSMAIFTIVIMVASGAFMMVSRSRGLTQKMRESQQKIRLSGEIISRLSRQASQSLVTDEGKTLTLFFNSTPVSGTRFQIKPSVSDKEELYLSRCSGACDSDLDWTYPQNLLSGEVYLKSNQGSGFSKSTQGIFSKLDVLLVGSVGELGTNLYFTDDFRYETSVLLENLK